MNARLGDIAAALTVLLFAGYVYYEAAQLDAGAGGFPRLIAMILGVAGAFLMVRSLRRADAGSPLAAGINWAMLGSVVAMWVTTILVLDIAGFFAMAGAFLAAAAWVLDGCPRGARPLLRIAVFASTTTVVLWVVFKQLLGLNPPSGFLF
jgi:putative tricarboxylic transport membrane protein